MKCNEFILYFYIVIAYRYIFYNNNNDYNNTIFNYYVSKLLVKFNKFNLIDELTK